MKILIDLTSLADNFSGVERFALSISKELIKHKEIDFILVFKNAEHAAFADSHKNVRKVVLKGKNKLIFNQIVLPTNLWKIKADCYLFLAFPAPFLFFSRKSVSAIHDMGCWDCPQSNKKWIIVYYRILYKKASYNKKKIITVSNFSAKRIQNLLKVEKDNIWIIYNGVSDVFKNVKYDNTILDEVKKKYLLPDSYLLCVSTIEPKKNIGLLINAYSELLHQEKGVNVSLVLVGRKGWLMDGLLSGLDEEVKQHIIFTGFVDDHDLPYIYMGAKLFVFPSLYEGFGIPPIEALSCETPVLASDIEVMKEVLGDSAYYFENNSHSDLVNQLRMLLMKKEELLCDNTILEKYDWELQANVLMNNIVKKE